MKMKKTTKVIAVSLAATMMLSACQTTGTNSSGQPLTEAEKRMREQSAIYTETVVTGGLAGCGLGIVAGLLLGGNAQNRAKGAAIGCAAGAALGAASGAYVASKQEQYATREEQLAATTKEVKDDNERLAGLIDATRQVMANDKARLDQIEIDLRKGQISKEQARKQLAAIDDNLANLDKTLEQLNKKKADYQEAAKAFAGRDAQSTALKAELLELETQVAQLEAERDALAKRRTISRVG